MIGSLKRTKEILNQYKIYARKSYGQNFLVDENILKKIIKTSNISLDDGVIEVGPGIGALTEFLLLNSKKVIAYEVDKNMVEILKKELDQYPSLNISNEDFLKAVLNIDKDFFDCKRVLVISNLPYYITTPIIMKLLLENSINEMYLMVQKEVGMRLSSKPKTKDYNALSVYMAYKSECKIEFMVPRNCFLPEPNVDSVVISIKKIKSKYQVDNEEHFLNFIQSLFSQRRKTLLNNIISSYPIPKEEILDILDKLNYSASIRSEELNLEEIYKLYLNTFASPK